jgi:hypothetical protein
MVGAQTQRETSHASHNIRRNPAAQAPLAAKLYFDCHDALRAERKRRYEV